MSDYALRLSPLALCTAKASDCATMLDQDALRIKTDQEEDGHGAYRPIYSPGPIPHDVPEKSSLRLAPSRMQMARRRQTCASERAFTADASIARKQVVVGFRIGPAT